MRMKTKKYVKTLRRKRNSKKSILNDEWNLEEDMRPSRLIEG